MSTDKLSELSKPVMYVVRTLDGSVASVKSHSYTAPKGFTSEPLYSQEYVSALLAELEAARKQSQELAAQCGRLGARAAIAERKLATPVRLPRPACVYADHSYPAYSRKQVEEIITSAGMRFTVEGDEQ